MDIEKLYSAFCACSGRISTDTRTLKGGELFFALKGENFDGNAYALAALDAGAAFAVVESVSEATSSGREGIIAVDDTLEALRALALHHRRILGAKGTTFIGLTGTNGKTTTKELIRSVLATKFKVAATSGNFNNDVGVPLTILSIPEGTQIAVVEMGASHPGDIKRLVEVCEPDMGLITNVGKAHLLGFGSFEGVKKTKGELYDWIAARGGEIFLNVDESDLVAMAAERSGLSILPYGPSFDGAAVLPADAANPFLRIKLGRHIIKTQLVGAYNAANVLAALSVGARFAVPIADAAKAIAQYEPANKRSQMVVTERNTLILDAYNANPTSMAAALDNFASVEAASKAALLGDMRELGADSLQEHCSIAQKALAIPACRCIFVGEEFAKALKNLGVEGESFPDSESLKSFLESAPISGATVLVKGSRGIQMEKVVPAL